MKEQPHQTTNQSQTQDQKPTKPQKPTPNPKNSSIPSSLNSKDWVDPQCVDYKNLQLQGNKITATGLKGALIFSKNLHNSFVIQIGNFINGIALGIVDGQYKNRDNLIYLNNRLVYGNDGRCWDGVTGNKAQGNGFKIGDIISVNVNRQEGKIQWKSNHGDILHTIESQMIGNKGDKGIRWVGYVCLWGKRDWVRILEQK